MTKRILQSVFLLAAAGSCALAQNSDLSILVGVSFPSSEVSSLRVRSEAGAGLQLNYAYQVWGSPAGELYVEIPVVLAGGSSNDISRRGIVSASGATILFTPGVRFRLPLRSRLALYAALGGGVGAFAGSELTISSDGISRLGRHVSPALGFGGGLDFRLTRLLSLRGEVRDFVGLSGFGGVSGRHRVLTQAGIAFHF